LRTEGAMERVDSAGKRKGKGASELDRIRAAVVVERGDSRFRLFVRERDDCRSSGSLFVALASGRSSPDPLLLGLRSFVRRA
jgi:hypothetical protein